MTHLFEEKQQFNQWWLNILLLLIAIIPTWGIVQQLIMGIPFGDKPMSDGGILLFSLLMFGLIALLKSISLKTTINKHGIKVTLFPFVNRTIKLESIVTCTIVNYGFVGYGVRYSFKYGVIYNISGKLGVLIKFTNGKQLVIGTQQAESMKTALKELGISIDNNSL